jgi:WD40 repeat protein
MASENHKPIIFLAFANDRDDGVKYLRNLPEELRQVRAALEKAKSAGLCDLVERANATTKDILDVFQNPEYRNRIAIFHYGGHANGYELLLESSEGKTQLAHAGGLAAFLGQQQGLQLVFLNGCSTQQQVQALLQANVPAVIATSQAIDDAVAATFATRFYQGLAGGASMRTAYNEAAATVRTAKGDNLRHLYAKGSPREDRWPWELYFKEGAESIAQWNLPAAVDDPTFGLPPIPNGDLPEEPFRHLHWFEREQAEVFFGRNHQIRELYERVTAPQTAPIILLYGQSGVGKSSLLAAGLMPRLEGTYEIYYRRREQKIGLLGTLKEILLSIAKENSVAEAWLALEHRRNKPLLVILDQVEGIYTRPNQEQSNEWRGFLEALQETFADPTHRPRGKLILGFRKEWLAEIDKQLGENRLNRSLVFLAPMDRRGIIEAIARPSRAKRLQEHYGLAIEEGLPEIIADDLLEDRDSPIAPTLQILLTKMWGEARERDYSQPRFDRDLYQTLKKQGILLKDFLDQQLAALKQWQPEVVDSGLALDILAFHTTSLGTTEQRTAEHLAQEYNHQKDVLPLLLQNCKDLYLLVDPAQNKKEKNSTVATRLAHDTLAPLIRERFDDSDKPGQRARRILENRAVEWRDGQQSTPLDEQDLAVVEQGMSGMRAWKPEEQILIEASRRKREQIQRRRKMLWRAGIAAIVLILVSAGIAWWQSVEAKRKGAINLARQLAARAELTRNLRPDLLQRSVLLAVESMYRFIALGQHSLEADQALRHGLALLSRPLTHFAHEDSINGVALSQDGRFLVMASVDHTAQVWEISTGKKVASLMHEREVMAVAFSAEGRYLATGSDDRTARIWDAMNWREVAGLQHQAEVSRVTFSPNEKSLATTSMDSTVWLWETSTWREVFHLKHDGNLTAIAFSPDEKYLATASDDSIARILEVTSGREVARLTHEGSVSAVTFSEDGKYLATASKGKTARMFEMVDRREVRRWPHESGVSAVAFSADGKYLATACDDGAGSIWETSSGQKIASIKHAQGIVSIVFSQDGKYVATASHDKTARVWETATGQEIVRIPHEHDVLFIAFMPDGKHLVTASRDGIAWVSEINNGREVAQMAHDDQVRAVVFSRVGKYLATASRDRTARVWETATGKEIAQMTHGSYVTDVAFSPDGKNLTTASWDRTARLWDATTGEEIAQMPHATYVNAVAFSTDAKHLATASDDSTAEIWDAINGLEVARVRHQGAVRAVAFGPDSRLLATASDDGTARIWEIIGGREIMQFRHEDKVRDVTFSPDGKYLATASDDKTARVWEAAGGREVKRMKHDQALWSVAFSPDGKYLATASQDRTARVWEITSSQEIARMSHDGEVFAVAFSPDGAYLATAGEDQTARLWLWRPEDLIKEACSRLTRNLTHEEWQQDLGDEPYRKTCPDLLVTQQ